MTKIITVDGPSGSGKGTVSRLLAAKLSFHYLDSGALYRVLSIAAMRRKVDTSNKAELSLIAEHMDVIFKTSGQGDFQILLEGEDVTRDLRTEDMGALASKIAAYTEVRNALLKRQRLFAHGDGLIADGRDMGTVVFPAADLKIYLTASIDERAKRRYKELIEKGEDVSLRALAEQVTARDERDMNREVSPLVAAEDAIRLDTSDMSAKDVLETILNIIDFKRLV
ncbi:(d)CMP kinase [Gammaproteobacteria bacterium]|nr:(d)CMP kinase [Gammaproteobacteria bacterium]|tara:strand:+ start:2894 stop:3568 length:675 start_codon:yes stop_codon:yes gene_type:complete